MKYFRGRKGFYLYKQLTFTNTRKTLLGFVRDNLFQLGYNPTRGKVKNIYISNKVDIMRFLTEIGLSNPKLIQKAQIKNSKGFIWKGRDLVRV